jgi:glycerol-3-phosphate O-acyltransferase
LVLHFFLTISFVSMSLLSADFGERSREEIGGDYRFLKDLFRLEFIYDQRWSDEEKIDRCLRFLEAGRHLTVSGQNGSSRFSVTLKGRVEMVYFAAMITNFLEAYGIVFNSLPSLEKKPAPEKELLARIGKTGSRLYKQGAVIRPESLSQLLFKNALRFCQEAGMIAVSDKGDGKSPLLNFLPEGDDRRKRMLSAISRFIRVEKYHHLEK